jgi:hypothetical protein
LQEYDYSHCFTCQSEKNQLSALCYDCVVEDLDHNPLNELERELLRRLTEYAKNEKPIYNPELGM